MPAFPTSTTVFDSILFRDTFGTPEMREVFSDFGLISRFAEVEVALAKAEARCGVIPAEAAGQIAERTDVSALDFDLLRSETDIVGYPILPLVHQMTKQCGEAGRYVHWGATTQDIMDTAVVLQVRTGLAIIEADIAALRGILADLPGHPARAVARRHKSAREEWYAELFARPRSALPKERARELALLAEGATALILIHGDRSYADTAARAARRLVRKN